MINIKIEGHLGSPAFPKIQPQLPWPLVNSVVQNLSDEARRRDEIVKKLYNEFPLKPGDTATAIPTMIDQIGERLIIVAVAKTYAELGRDDPWPVSDRPLMVHVKSYDKNSDFLVATSSVKRNKG